MMTNFLEDVQLSNEEIDKLQKILTEKQKKKQWWGTNNGFSRECFFVNVLHFAGGEPGSYFVGRHEKRGSTSD